MGADASWPLQQAILDRLETHRGIIAIFNDSGPEAPDVPDIPGSDEARGALPVYRYGDGVARSWHSATFDGQEHDIAIELWTDDGVWPARELAARIIDVLHGADLELRGHALIDLQFQQSETRTCDRRGKTHCVVRFRALTVVD